MIKLLPTFIARSKTSLDDFLDSDFSTYECKMHCHFDERHLTRLDLGRLKQSGVNVLSFMAGDVYLKKDHLWVDEEGQEFVANAWDDLPLFPEDLFGSVLMPASCRNK
ncbi:hypothetical protein [Enterovibrio norvegicus]|uniref:hypothetical protein n=1 Tax=Enterovibrio norvegicus TaxID=188144 RepID=UPI000C828ECE|nr:hypothetical protein [Enterovibrio norvegicus]PMH64539.1 hypothetical protein BCU62_15910 [Enterovibrio norvegicus]